MIPFSKCSITHSEKKCVLDALDEDILSGDGKYTRMVTDLYVEKWGIDNFLLTASGTASLELAAMIAPQTAGAEVILPSFTFSSTANAFLRAGMKPVFCDIDTDTLNLDPHKIAPLITHKTRAICAVHYGGIPCDMDIINKIASEYNLYVIEDAAQAVGSTYKGKHAGTLSDCGCYSYHATKNYVMGEGGGIVFADSAQLRRAEILREKGTNRSAFLRGQVDKYTWQEAGASFLPSDILAAVLYAQLMRFDEIMQKRGEIWNAYHEQFKPLECKEYLRRPVIPGFAEQNYHVYYLILPSEKTRDGLMDYLRGKGISAVTHYVPLDTSPMAVRSGLYTGNCPLTQEYAARLLRLPLFPGMTAQQQQSVAENVVAFIKRR